MASENKPESYKLSYEQLETAFSNITDYINVIDEDGRILHVNHGTEVGRNSISKVLGSSVFNLVAENYKEPFRATVRMAFETGNPQSVQVQNHKGEWFEVKVLPQRIDPKIAFCISHNFTSLKKTQTALEESTQQFQTVIENLPVTIFAVSPQWKFLLLQGEVLDQLGTTKVDWIGRDVLDFYSKFIPLNVSKVTHNLTRAFSGERLISTAEAFGAIFELHYIPLFAADGKVSCVVGIVYDITSHVEKEDQLRAAKSQAEKASQVKTEFLANVSHELRTPLSIILGFAELLDDKNLTEVEKDTYLETIQKNGKHLLRLIEDILDVSKIETGGFACVNKEFSLKEEMSSIMFALGALAKKRNLSLYISYETDVPAKLYSDPMRLRQALMNIIGNGIKFTETGGIDIVVKMMPPLTEKKEKNLIGFYVSDTGVGIDEKYWATLFAPFERVDTSMTRKQGGIGLGLALSRKIANALGGTLELVESAVGKGSTFLFTINSGVEKISSIETIANTTYPNFTKTVEARGG